MLQAQSSPIMPLSVLLPVCAGSFILVLMVLRRFPDFVTRFLFVVIWLRFTMSAFHPFTFPPLVLGLSLNALASCAFIAIGLLSLNLRLLTLKSLVPLYLLIAVSLVSAVVNAQLTNGINSLVKFLFLIVITLAAYEAMHRHGHMQVLKGLLIVFVVPIILQWLSVAMDIGKATEADGSISFIGGYFHEASFSVILVTFLYVVFLGQGRGMLVWTCLVVGIVGLGLANYRTSILSVLPPLAAFFLTTTLGHFVSRHRLVILIALVAVCAAVIAGSISLVGDRFQDIATALQKGASLVKPPMYFTSDERALFSGRAYIWSQYLYSWVSGQPINILLGFGPDSWEDRFPKYAHNTLVSYAYEFGLAGLFAIVYLLLRNFRLALEAPVHARFPMVAAYLGFFLLNLATMPLWQIEGNILFAILLARTWHIRRASAGVGGEWRTPHDRIDLHPAFGRAPLRGSGQGAARSYRGSVGPVPG
jgi:hypothetical protein